MKEPKNCPVCGPRARYDNGLVTIESSAIINFVGCRVCGLTGPEGFDQQEAVRCWNKLFYRKNEG